VHLLKSVRNNWLGQTDAEKTFSFLNFPCSDDVHKVVSRSSFSQVRRLYYSEKDNIVRLARSLTYKAQYPSSLERQNVKLALKVFGEKTNVAPDEYGTLSKCDFSGTQTFVNIILKLWKILNVKSIDNLFRKRDNDSRPISDVNDDRLSYLHDVYLWLCTRENLEGRLTNETQVALKHTVKCYIDLVQYLPVTLPLRYVLMGKFQTDPLEAGFGKHRRLARNKYHISVEEIMESEKKPTLISFCMLFLHPRAQYP
jgi:hypothetical protein